jgi:hypothetical protein
MTAARHSGKGSSLLIGLIFLAVSLLAGGAGAVTTERIVADPNSGLAIYGFDPIAYFTDGTPVRGREDVELIFAGAVWRFRHESDRAAFLAHPDVYAPQFGGYDPVDVAKGRTIPGHPQIWLVRGQRLYLFASERNRATFARTAPTILVDAFQRWPTLYDGLSE